MSRCWRARASSHAEPSWYGLLFSLDRDLVRCGLVADVLAALRAEGCCEVDHPKITASVHH